MSSFLDAINTDSVFLLKFPLRSHIRLMLCVIYFDVWNIYLIFFSFLLLLFSCLYFSYQQELEIFIEVTASLLDFLLFFLVFLSSSVGLGSGQSIFPLTSGQHWLFSKFFGIFLYTLPGTDIIVTFMYHSFFISREKSWYLPIFPLCFHPVICWKSKINL